MVAPKPPAKNPCGSCPYRRDVPSGLWDPSEYAKLPKYDGETFEQPPGVFLCHQQDGRMCAGWVGCHDQSQLLAIRLWSLNADPQDVDEVLDYSTEAPLFDSGAEAAEHGMAEVDVPGYKAVRQIERLTKKLAQTNGGTRK